MCLLRETSEGKAGCARSSAEGGEARVGEGRKVWDGGGVGRCKRADRAEAQPGIWDIAFLQREPLRLISRGMI